MNIEIALRLGSAALSRKSHKEIAFPEDIVAVPVQVVFVNLKIRDVFLRVPFKAVIDNRVEVSVQFCWSQQRCLLVDLFIVVNDFVDIDIVLIIGIVMNDELSRDSRHDILECCIDNAKKKVCIVFRHGIQIEAEVIFQVFCRQSELHIEAVCR